jgi:hypothetical protein
MSNEIDWTGAACIDKYETEQFDDIFFPESGEGHAYAIAKAKLLCSKCPLALQCFEFAMKGRYEGVWGNSTTQERENMRLSPRAKREHVINLAEIVDQVS